MRYEAWVLVSLQGMAARCLMSMAVRALGPDGDYACAVAKTLGCHELVLLLSGVYAGVILYHPFLKRLLDSAPNPELEADPLAASVCTEDGNPVGGRLRCSSG